MIPKAKLFGHFIHPMLIVFPLGLLATSLVFDIIYLATGNGKWTEMSEYMIGAGVIGGVLAAVFGLVDWLSIPDGTRARSVGFWHGLGNGFVMALFIVNWFLRYPSPSTPGVGPIILSFVGI